MYAIIDLRSELLIDRSTVGDPYLRLLLTAIGQELAEGSPWVAVNRSDVSEYGLSSQTIAPRTPRAVA